MIINLLKLKLRFTRSSSTFCSIPPNLEMIQAISFRGHCPPPRSQIIVHLVRLSIDRRHMSSAPAAVGAREGDAGPAAAYCGVLRPFAECILLFCCCSLAVLKATTRSAKSSAAPTSACVTTASVRVLEGGREADDDVAPMCSTHAKYTLRAGCMRRANATDPSESTTRGASSNEGGSRSTSAERLTRTGKN